MAERFKKTETAGVKAPVVKEVKGEVPKAPKVVAPKVKEPKVEEVKSRNPKGCGKCPITYGHALCNSCVEYKK
jgi:hypothetical protein